MTPSIDGGFRPNGGGVQGFASASLMAACKITLESCDSLGGVLQEAATAAAAGAPVAMSSDSSSSYKELHKNIEVGKEASSSAAAKKLSSEKQQLLLLPSSCCSRLTVLALDGMVARGTLMGCG
jgi:hypothetical protein